MYGVGVLLHLLANSITRRRSTEADGPVKRLGQRLGATALGTGFIFTLAILANGLAIMTSGVTIVRPRALAVTEGSPAWAAGVRPGDLFVKVNGADVSSDDEFKAALTAATGSAIVALITPSKVPMTVSLPAVGTRIPEEEMYPGVRAWGVKPKVAPFATANAKFKFDDEIKSIGGIPVHSFQEAERVLAEASGRALLFFVADAAGAEREIHLEKPQAGWTFAALGVESADLYIGNVLPHGPADAAGIKIGDRVVSLNGTQLGSFTQLAALVQSESARGSLKFTIRRQTETIQAQVIPLREIKTAIVDGQFVSAAAYKIGLTSKAGNDGVDATVTRTPARIVTRTVDFTSKEVGLFVSAKWRQLVGTYSTDFTEQANNLQGYIGGPPAAWQPVNLMLIVGQIFIQVALVLGIGRLIWSLIALVRGLIS
jgi:membrane-associated protease RseP (regulator of RpoE activity)